MSFNPFVTLSCFLALGLGSTVAQASDLSYDYAELRFVDTEVGNNNGDGFRLGGSYSVTPNWLVVGGVSTLDFGSNFDINVLEIGAGYVHRYTPKLDIVGYAKLLRAEVDTIGGDDSDTGFSIAGGVRGSFTAQIEGRAMLNHIDIDGSDTFIELGGDYHFNPQLSAGATLEFAGDADTLTIGARWYFNN